MSHMSYRKVNLVSRLNQRLSWSTGLDGAVVYMGSEPSSLLTEVDSRLKFEKLFLTSKGPLPVAKCGTSEDTTELGKNFREFHGFLQETFSTVFRGGSRNHLWVFGGVLREVVNGSLKTYFESGGKIDIVQVLKTEDFSPIMHPKPYTSISNIFDKKFKNYELLDNFVDGEYIWAFNIEDLTNTNNEKTIINVDLIQYTGNINNSITNPTPDVNLLAINLVTGEVISRDPKFSVESIIYSIKQRSFMIVNGSILTGHCTKFIKLMSHEIIESFKEHLDEECKQHKKKLHQHPRPHQHCSNKCRLYEFINGDDKFMYNNVPVYFKNIDISDNKILFRDENEGYCTQKIYSHTFSPGRILMLLREKCIVSCAKLYRYGFKLVKSDEPIFHQKGYKIADSVRKALYWLINDRVDQGIYPLTELNNVKDLCFLKDIGVKEKKFNQIFPLACYNKNGDLSWLRLDPFVYWSWSKSIDKEISPKELLSCGILHHSLRWPYGIRMFDQEYIDILGVYIENNTLNCHNRRLLNQIRNL